MKTAPIRWICGACLKVERRALTVYLVRGFTRSGLARSVSVCLPLCCGREMLIAGEPKRDVHGLREKGVMIDPVDNLKTRGMVA